MAKKKSKKQIEQITINELINEELSTRTDSLKILDKEFGVLDDISNLFNENIKANKKQADVLGDIVDATKSVLENNADITDETMTHVDLHKLERKLIREGVRDTGQIISKLKEKQNIQIQTNRIVNRQAGIYKSIGDTTEKLMNLQKQKKDLQKDEREEAKKVTNNNMFVGSTTDLQRMLLNRDNVIDGESKE